MAEIGDIIRNFREGSSNRFRVILLCFLAATTFWFLNALNKEHTTTIKYPLEFLYDHQAYVAVDDLPEEVMINVNAVGWNLLKNSLGIKVSPLKIPVENPLDTRKIAANTLPGLISEQLNDFQLNYVLTDTLRLHLDQRITKTIFLDVDTANISLSPGVRIKSQVNITPDSIVMEGAASELNALNDTIRITLENEDIDGDYNELVGIDLPKAVTAKTPREVRIRFEVAEYIERSVRVPVQPVNFPMDSSVQFFPREVVIRYHVNADEDNVNPAAFRVVADYNKLNLADSSIKPGIAAYPERIGNVKLDSVMIRVQKTK